MEVSEAASAATVKSYGRLCRIVTDHKHVKSHGEFHFSRRAQLCPQVNGFDPTCSATLGLLLFLVALDGRDPAVQTPLMLTFLATLDKLVRVSMPNGG